MSSNSPFLLTSQPRARWMRFDTAQILKRFFFCERSLLVSQAAWIPAVAPLDIKTDWPVSSGRVRRLLTPYAIGCSSFVSPAAFWRSKEQTVR